MNERTVFCKVCGQCAPFSGTQLCSGCWEIINKVESAAMSYDFRSGKYLDKINKVLKERGCKLRLSEQWKKCCLFWTWMRTQKTAI